MNGIYEKALVISNNARRVTSTGAITNYVSECFFLKNGIV